MKLLSDYIKKNKEEPTLVSFSGNSAALEFEFPEDNEKESLLNFSGDSESSPEELSELVNFSLVKFIKERQRAPRQVIRERVNHIVRYINSTQISKLAAERKLIVEYLNSYLYSQIFKYMKGVRDGVDTNILLTLGIRPFVKDVKKATKLQRELKRLSQDFEKQGFMRKDLQKRVKEAYEDMYLEILSTIEESKIKEEKRGILVPQN